MKTTITLSNELIIRSLSLDSPEEIEQVMQEMRTTLHQMFEDHIQEEIRQRKHRIQQAAYQHTYHITDETIVRDFNGDRLDMAMAIRGYEASDMVKAIGLTEDIYTSLCQGLVLPSHEHLQKFMKYLRFPLPFFTDPRKMERDRQTFMCGHGKVTISQKRE